jgi:hypothetical protein
MPVTSIPTVVVINETDGTLGGGSARRFAGVSIPRWRRRTACRPALVPKPAQRILQQATPEDTYDSESSSQLLPTTTGLIEVPSRTYAVHHAITLVASDMAYLMVPASLLMSARLLCCLRTSMVGLRSMGSNPSRDYAQQHQCQTVMLGHDGRGLPFPSLAWLALAGTAALLPSSCALF